MSEEAKLRVVRCPKCENLLSEHPDYSVYQCGGCGAILEAARSKGDVNALSENSDEERVEDGLLERFSERSENIDVSQKRMASLTDDSQIDVESNGRSLKRVEKRRSLNDGIKNCGASSMAKADKWIVQDSLEKMEEEFEDVKPQTKDAIGLRNSGEVPDWKTRERNETERFRRNQEIDVIGRRHSTSEEGPSNYQSQGNYHYADTVEQRGGMDGFEQVGYLGEDRAELLRKLDELKDQISRSFNLVDNPKDKDPLDRRIPQDPYGRPDKQFPEGYSARNGASVQHSFPDKNAARPSYAYYYAESSPFMDRNGMAGHGFYPPTHNSGLVHEFEDPLRSQMLRRGQHQASAPFQPKLSHTPFSGPYMDRNLNYMDSFESYPLNTNHHHMSCSCFHCYTKYQVPPQVPSNAYGDRQFYGGSKDPAFYHHENPNRFVPQDHSAKGSDLPSFKSHNSQPQTRYPSGVNSEASGFVHRHPSRVLLGNSGRRCRPVAGGAPFLACQNCYELLQLPKKVFVNSKNQKKVRCGACSSLILLVKDAKRLDASFYADVNKTNAKDNLIHNRNLSEVSLNAFVYQNRDRMNFSSEDYDISGFNFQSMDRELGLSTGQGSSIKSGDIKSLRSTYSSCSEGERNMDNFPALRSFSNSAELLAEGKMSPPPAGSSLQEYFDYSNKYHVVNRFGDGNRSGRSERDKATPNKTTSSQNFMKDASATEIEISSNEYSINTGTSTDSGEASKEGDQLRANRTAEPFFAGIMKKSFKDFSKSNDDAEPEKAHVTVNGNLIPDRLIKKAEKLAGPIQPGHYWYDFRAGFWGAIGGPCLGIIPPFIEEFNYPMLENCTGGKTGVFVNGRELHKKDLSLLGSRGLPTERDRSYIVEVSGRVLDEHTGEELESLGRLAPTVERLKRGFGMKDPKVTT